MLSLQRQKNKFKRTSWIKYETDQQNLKTFNLAFE